MATDGGTRLATTGRRAMLHAPDASTTVRHRHSPQSVRTKNPAPSLLTDVTVVWVLTGAEIALA
jgi:hypothetical protein